MRPIRFFPCIVSVPQCGNIDFMGYVDLAEVAAIVPTGLGRFDLLLVRGEWLRNIVADPAQVPGIVDHWKAVREGRLTFREGGT